MDPKNFFDKFRSIEDYKKVGTKIGEGAYGSVYKAKFVNH